MEELENASVDVTESHRPGRSRLVVLGPLGSEVYVDDERRASVGSSGRVVLSDIPPGRHILRVSKPGERDDERVIEIRDDAAEQVIQAQLRVLHPSHPSQAGSSAGASSSRGQSSVIPGIVACANCGSRFAEGIRFCGRCGGGTFRPVEESQSATRPCPRCGSTLRADARFCGRCGLSSAPTVGSGSHTAQFVAPHRSVPPQAERLCGRCGTAYAAHIRFCGRCGTNL
jgi:ribosomal protein S27AE